MEVYGLRAAKRLAQAQLAQVKGDRSEFATGYRRGINELVATIDAEIKRQMPLSDVPKILRDREDAS